MTDLSPLYQFRSVVDGEATPAPSRYRAVRNATAAYARNQGATISIETRSNGHDWGLSEEGMTELAKAIADMPMAHDETTLESSIRELGNVCRLLSGRKTLTDTEAEVLANSLMKVTMLMNQAPVASTTREEVQ